MVVLAAIAGFLALCALFSACIYKRNYWAAYFLPLPPMMLFGACRLAHPNSWWARRFYTESEKMRRAEERYGARAPDEADKGWGFALDAPPRWPRSAKHG
jgi:hypothetical protein